MYQDCFSSAGRGNGRGAMSFLMSFAMEPEIVPLAWIDNASVQFPLNIYATKGSIHRLHREGRRFWHLARVPVGRALGQLDCPGLVEMEHRVELAPQPRPEIVARALGVGTIDHPDGPLKPGKLRYNLATQTRQTDTQATLT